MTLSVFNFSLKDHSCFSSKTCI